MRLGQIGDSMSLAISDTEATGFTVSGPTESHRALIVSSDVPCYLTRDGTAASSTNGLRIPADTLLILVFNGGDVLSILGAASGNVWLTATDG